ncbi:MAG: TonB-dependent receptor [Syntrophaceae bacterium]|nr:TonB-dependent receptor [Syntrophaceae bacterium]
MKSVIRFLAVSFFTCACLSIAVPLKAADSPAVMEEVVVTATRGAEEVRNVPAAVTVITEKEIRDSGAVSLVEVLEKVEGIQVRSYSGNSPQSIVDLRGFGGDNPFGKTVILLDGQRLNRPDMASVNWFQVPLSSIERVEVVRGASSVLYGDAAVAGVINIITRKGTPKTRAYASVTGGSYGLHNEKAGASGRTGSLSYSVQGENYFSLGYRKHSTLASQSAGLNLRYDAADALSASLGVSFNRSDYELPGNLTRMEMASDRRQAEPARPSYWTSGGYEDDGLDKHTNINLKIESLLGAFGRLEMNALYGKKELDANMASWTLYTNTEAETYGLTPKYILDHAIFGFSNKLTTGIDVYREPYVKKFYDSRERRARTAIADLYKNSLAFYVRDEFSVFRNLILSAGYRTERAAMGGDYNNHTTPAQSFTNKEKIHHGEACEGGLTWLIGKKSSVFAKYATVFRFPFLDEQASYNGYGGTPFYTDIEKETGRSYEAGTQFFPLDSLKIALSVFRIDMENEIAWNSLTYRNENLDETRHDGVEASFSWQAAEFARIYGSLTYHRATFESGENSGKEIPLVPRRQARLGVEFSLPYAVTVKPEVRYVGDSYMSGDTDNSGEKLESHTVFDLYAFYRPEFRGLKLTVFLGVENLLNATYSSFGVEETAWTPRVYYPMPERTFKGGLTFEF